MKPSLPHALLALAILVQPALAQPVKIGYVNAFRIETESKRAQEITESLKREFAGREQEMRAMETKLKSLQAQVQSAKPGEREARERELIALSQRYEQMGRSFVEDLERRKAEERRKYFQEVTQVVNKIAQAEKYDLVLQEAVYSSRAIDITDQVLKALGGAAAPPKPPAK